MSEAAPQWAAGVRERFVAYLRSEKKAESTIEKYDHCLRDFLVWVGRRPETWTKQDMQAYKEHLASTRKLSENSMVVEISAINQYTEHVLERKDLKMTAPKRVERERMPLTEEEAQKVLEQARKRNARDHAMLALMYHGELRASEVTNLWVGDLDFARKKVRIRNGKGGDYSIVNLSDYAVDALKEYLQDLRPFIAPATPEDANMLILSVNGRAMHRNDAWRIVKKLAFEAGIKKNTFPHLLRHSGITRMAEKDINVFSIKAQSRHKRLETVMKYVHMNQSKVRDDYDRVFANNKLEASNEAPKLKKIASPEPMAGEDDKVVSDIAALLSGLSDDKRRKLFKKLGSHDHRIELHGG